MKLLEEAKLRLAVIHALKVNSTIFVNSAFPCSTPQHCKHCKLETFTIKKKSVTKNISMWCWTIWCKLLLNNRYFIQFTLSFKLGLHFSTFFFSEHMHRSYNMTIAFAVLLAKILPGSCIPLLDWVKYRVDKTCWIYTCITVTQLTVNLLLFAENFSVRTGPCPID